MAIDDDDWDHQMEDYDSAGPSHITGAWAGTEAYPLGNAGLPIPVELASESQPPVQSAIPELAGLHCEPHIPHGSGDAEYRLIDAAGRVVAIIDPEMAFDAPADVAEALVVSARAHAGDPVMSAAHDMLAALKATRPALILLGNYIGNEWPGGGGIDAFDRCEIIGSVRTAIDKAEGR